MKVANVESQSLTGSFVPSFGAVFHLLLGIPLHGFYSTRGATMPITVLRDGHMRLEFIG